jgi:hypothetical protein
MLYVILSYFVYKINMAINIIIKLKFTINFNSYINFENKMSKKTCHLFCIEIIINYCSIKVISNYIS